jgi:transcriptional regulator with GAF, ATPase, and Fis domain
MSRRHATVYFDGQRFRVVDHGSHNGTYLDGARIQQSISSTAARVLRTGDSVFLLSPDVRPQQSAGVVTKELILGPGLQLVFEQAARAAQYGRTLHVHGESGSGKEGVVRAFHERSPLAAGPLVALNCATIAAGVAERLLFGAKRGAFSGSFADSDGLIQAADGGTLFLDEIGELDPAVQAKLLRVLETQEVLPLGALKGRRVNMQLCTASHRDLRVEVSSGRFREDLYFRISSPQVVVPPLRQRLEEIPWLVVRAVGGLSPDLTAHSSFVEACLLRHWPGNVRELLAAVRVAGQEAIGLGAHRLEAQHLSPRAGMPIEKPDSAARCALLFHPPIPKSGGPPERSDIESALRASGGNISAAARALGLHRTQLTRLLDKYSITIPRGDELEQDTEG